MTGPAAPDGSPAVTIRVASTDDAAALVDLLQGGSLVEGKEDPTSLAAYRTALVEIGATAGNEVLVAELDGAVVGMCQLIVFRHLHTRGGRCAEIESMHVAPGHRGRGIGGRLLEYAVGRAAGSGCYRVQLTSNRAREAAHRFYRRHGFEPTHLGFKRLLVADPGDPAAPVPVVPNGPLGDGPGGGGPVAE